MTFEGRGSAQRTFKARKSYAHSFFPGKGPESTVLYDRVVGELSGEGELRTAAWVGKRT
jgi:hypothetical protein